jgi:hypothetical protein
MRAVASEWFQKYRLFFAYVACVFAQDLFFLEVYFNARKFYSSMYWSAEFLTVVLGCGVTWEIFQGTLKRCRGAARMASSVLIFVLVTAISKIAVNVWDGVAPWPGTMVELERNLRTVQAAFLIALGLLVVYYGIPMGRNLIGIFFGYGLFISTSVLNLTLRAFLGAPFQAAWVYLQPLCYLAVLTIWCVSLWNYREVPAPRVEPRIESDYEQLALATRKGFLQVRAYLDKGFRS